MSPAMDTDKRREIETRWLREIAAGGRAAQRAKRDLFEVYEPKVLAFYWKKRVDGVEAEDLWMDVFVKIVTNAGEFEPGTKPSAWIFTLAKNHWLDWLRRRNVRRGTQEKWEDPVLPDELASSGDEPPQAVDRRAVSRCIHAAWPDFEREHPKEAAAMYLSGLEEWTNKEMAEYLERSLGATNQFLYQARKKAKLFFDHCWQLLR